jgi:NAD(P)-dependent dehydrogenase (short-subunit alcohol dehydrogenase family)
VRHREGYRRGRRDRLEKWRALIGRCMMKWTVRVSVVQSGRSDYAVGNPMSRRGVSAWARGEGVAYLCACRAVVHMQNNGDGVIISIAGMSARSVIRAETKLLADELGPSGIRILGVDPGVTDTAHLRENAVARYVRESGRLADDIVATIPCGPFTQPSEAADTSAAGLRARGLHHRSRRSSSMRGVVVLSTVHLKRSADQMSLTTQGGGYVQR